MRSVTKGNGVLSDVAGALIAVVAGALVAVLAVGCTNLETGSESEIEELSSGKIRLSISDDSYEELKEAVYAMQSVWSDNMANLDTNNFILSIYTEQGSKVYEGKYGKRPQEIVVVPGAYDIKLYSGKGLAPAFESPIYGDEQTVIVEASSSIDVTLVCKQVNAAMRISFTDDFRREYPGDGLKLKDVNGEVLYPYATYDFCYIMPGTVELLYNNGVMDTLLFTRKIAAAQMISLNLSYSKNKRSASIKLDLDTTRSWSTENYDVGLNIPTGAMTINQAKENIGEKNVMIFGYIFGGDATENTIRVRPPFKSRTNIVIAPSMNERKRTNMFVVELPSGEIRDALNLVSNRSLLGSAVVITGNIVGNYYGYPGIKGVKAYSLLY